MIYKKFLLTFFSPFLVLYLFGQNVDTKQKNQVARFELSLNQDANFGFYPGARAVFPISQSFELGGYGNYYTNPAYATSDGTGPWTEFGLLVNFNPIQSSSQNLFLSSSVGLSNGNVLSGDSVERFAEGLSLGLTAVYNYSTLEFLASGSYFLPFKKRGIFSNSFYFYMLSAGVYILPSFSIGTHYENNETNFLKLKRTEQTYEWIGVYFKFIVSQKYTLQFTGGRELADNGTNSFYKLELNISLQ